MHDDFTFDKTEQPLSAKYSKASGKVYEASFLFKVQRGRSYTLFIYYGGEMNYDQDGQEECEYYNLYLALSHLSYFRDTMKCFSDKDLKD